MRRAAGYIRVSTAGQAEHGLGLDIQRDAIAEYCQREGLDLVAVFEDRIPGRAIVFATLDNLVKGSSGQALQNFNLMFGLEETTGLTQQPLFP